MIIIHIEKEVSHCAAGTIDLWMHLESVLIVTIFESLLSGDRYYSVRKNEDCEMTIMSGKT